eukprot:468615-Prymnesium_polylepis.1
MKLLAQASRFGPQAHDAHVRHPHCTPMRCFTHPHTRHMYGPHSFQIAYPPSPRASRICTRDMPSDKDQPHRPPPFRQQATADASAQRARTHTCPVRLSTCRRHRRDD